MSAARGSGAAGFAVDGLRTDQAPPLSIPASFFLLAPVAMIAGGVLLMFSSTAVTSTRWTPMAFAATHVGTLGFLGSIMLGALYQMIPVVAGAPVPLARLAHLVHLAFAGGVAILVVGLATGSTTLLAVAPLLLGAALVAFLLPVTIALARASTRGETVWGMRFAVAGLGALAIMGVLMALARTGRIPLRGDWVGWVTAHATLGALVWIGGLITAVSFQVIPMFYLTSPLPAWGRLAILFSVAIALLGVPMVVLAGGSGVAVALIASPAAVAVWLLHPALVAQSLRRRKRRRADASLEFWWAGLCAAPVTFLLALITLAGDHPRWSVALGFVAVWGWAGLIAHGMLSRIVPFLTWFHRFSSLVGRADVPSMRGLLPDKRARLGLWLHAGGVAMGLIAILVGVDVITRMAGALLAMAGIVLAANLVHVLRRLPTSEMLRPPAALPSTAGASSP